ncbi:hypothetical protein FJZ31_29895 [Candidatus Poribacteria bacterium]|nr:hypothetical protein [Candidatus Poribacteria bacterium]
MKIQKTAHNIKRNFIWLLVGLTFIGLLGLASISLAEDVWTKKADMPTARALFAAAVVDGKIYAFGGLANWAALSTVEVYDAKTDTWEKKANMPNAICDLSAAVVNGEIYVVGGQTPINVPTKIVAVYNPKTDTWMRKADLPIATMGMGIGVVNGKIYTVGGGTLIPEEHIATVQEYAPLTDKWTRKTDMPTPRGCCYMARWSTIIFMLLAVGGMKGP